MDPLVTIAGNGYCLVIDTPTGPLAIPLTAEDADRCFDNGVNYEDQVEGTALAAVLKLI
jgi:hypothetical protein